MHICTLFLNTHIAQGYIIRDVPKFIRGFDSFNIKRLLLR